MNDQTSNLTASLIRFYDNFDIAIQVAVVILKIKSSSEILTRSKNLQTFVHNKTAVNKHSNQLSYQNNVVCYHANNFTNKHYDNNIAK